VHYQRSPIIDTRVPLDLAEMRAIQLHLRALLGGGRKIYVHCRAGIGRTGTVIGCYLAEQGPLRGIDDEADEGLERFSDLADGTLAAVSNIDPFGRAAVMSRGITGDRRGEATVASPLLKQVFSLRDGRCLDDESHALALYDVRVTDGIVHIARR